MADNDNGEEPRGLNALKLHVLEHKVDVALWLTRVFTVLFTVGYFIPLFWNPYSFYYKALLCNAATSALRLHQRLPQVTFTRAFLQELLLEDSCHYLIYSIIFLYISPITMVLLPIFLFGILHSASYSLTLLDGLHLFGKFVRNCETGRTVALQTLGQNAWWGARLLISIVEFQSRNVLRLVSFTEIFLLPFTVFIIFLGRGSLLTPFLYYQFLCLRYASRRNPYTRNMFHELRVVIEGVANKPAVPEIIKNLLLGIVATTSRLAPPVNTAQ